jgi:selenocysteine lyase/cysteine desulfurase
MSAVAEHEAQLTAYALQRLPRVPGIRLYGDTNPNGALSRLGVIPFKLETVPHFLVSAVLGHEFGIGVRSGCFCAHPYILHLLNLSSSEAQQVRKNMLAGDRTDMPGLVRASFGLYNTIDEVDALVEALDCITRGKFRGKYSQDKASGEYLPLGWAPDFNRYFSLTSAILTGS